MSVYAIGDIQGCFDELCVLLETIHFNPAIDRLWFTGDLVNRGPQSLEVLRFVKDLGDRAVVVLGNHDLHLLAAAHDLSPVIPLDSFYDVLEAPDSGQLLAWLRHRPLLHHDGSLGFTLIHAGMPPQWDLALAQACAGEVERVLRGDAYQDFLAHMYGDEPDRWSDDLSGPDRLRFIVNCLTRLRFCDARGRVLLSDKGAPGAGSAAGIPWFKLPQRRSARLKIIFGHWSTLGRYADDGVYGLDTGCVWGGALTALRLDDGAWFSISCEGVCMPGEP